LLALIQQDFVRFERLLQEFVLALLSYHDLGRDKPAEAVMQAFILGLLAGLGEDYTIRSNREAGLGRADIMMIPHDHTQPGFILELKSIEETADIAASLDEALQQINTQRYGAELVDCGVAQIVAVAMVLQGKLVKIKTGDSPQCS
jgi:hypothetical protein